MLCVHFFLVVSARTAQAKDTQSQAIDELDINAEVLPMETSVLRSTVGITITISSLPLFVCRLNSVPSISETSTVAESLPSPTVMCRGRMPQIISQGFCPFDGALSAGIRSAQIYGRGFRRNTCHFQELVCSPQSSSWRAFR